MKKLSLLTIALLAVVTASTLAQSGSWAVVDTLYPSRRFCAGTVLDGKMYVIGGELIAFPPTHISELFYDPVTNKWDSTMAQLPFYISRTAASAVNGKLYVIGGENFMTGSPPLNSVYEYNPATDKWTRKTDMPTPRVSLRTVVVDNMIYAIGGDFHKQAVEMYDPQADTWTSKANMIRGRTFFAAETLNGKIYAIGGASDPSNTASVEVYDPQTDTWTYTESLPQSISMHGSGVINGQLYVFGGLGEHPPTWRFDAETSEWVNVNADMPVLNAGFASYTAKDATGAVCFYTIGGAGGDLIGNGLVLKYCPEITATKAPGVASAPAVLFQNYPNPFTSSTVFRYALKNPGVVNIKIFNLAGQDVGTIFNGFQEAGEHEFKWDAKGLQPGLYFYSLRTELCNETKRFILK